MRKVSAIILVCSFLILAAASTAGAVYDVTYYGATGNGSTLDTNSINAAITAADANGGGTVYFPPGTYKSGSIRMKDNITLDLDANAIILATDTNDYDLWDYNPWEEYQGFHSHWKCSLIWAIERNNIAITGTGLIDGSAMTTGEPDPYYGDRSISFKSCNGVCIEGISIYRGGAAAIRVTGCNDMDINSVTIDTNRDGMNIDCCNDVNITNCIVNSPKDDAICLKSTYALGYKKPCENVNISKCTVMGHVVGYLLFPPGSDPGYSCGSIKFGTESNGGFKNVTITDCNFELSRGFMLATVDGGDIENIIIDNIQMTQIVDPPIFMRLGNRGRGPGPPPPGTYRNVNISNVTAETTNHRMSCIISGIPGHCIEDVNLTNINITYWGGGSEADGEIELGENESGYPYGGMFGTVTPSYGFYVRHVNAIEFHDSDLSFNSNDSRPAFVLVDVNGFELDNVNAERYYTSGDHIKFDEVDDANIHDCTDFPLTTASYVDMATSAYKITAGKPFVVTVSATAGPTGICTTDMLMDSNYFDTEYDWLNAGVAEDVEFSDIQLYSLGEHRLEIAACDVNIGICPLGDFDLSGKTDSNDYAIFAADWLKEGQIVLQNDPVAWWKFEEESGSYAYDSSVNTNTGTLHNMTSGDWVTGYDGGALDFDGGNDYISVNDSNSVSVGGGDFTICAWIYPHSISGWRGIVTKVKNTMDKEYAFSLANDGGDGGLGLDVEWAANNGLEYTAPIVTAYEWQHVMVVFDSALLDATFYHNFEPVPVVHDAINHLPRYFDDNLCIGRWGGDYENKYFDGIIDDVRIYNYTISHEVLPTDLYSDYIIDFNDLDIFTNNWLVGEVLDINVPVESDFVSWWKFDDGSGGTASDSAGSNNGSLQGDTGWTTGHINGALSFDGDGDYVNCGSDSSLDVGSNMTLSLWVYADTWEPGGRNYSGIVTKRDTFATMDWELYYNNATDEILMYDGSIFTFDNLNVNPSTSTWHHIAITKQGTTAAFYLDGVPKGTDSAAATWGTGDSLRIAVLGGDTTNYGFDGKIDDVRIYDEVLTQQEIEDLAGM